MRADTHWVLYTSRGVETDLDGLGPGDVERRALAPGQYPSPDDPPGVWLVAGRDLGPDSTAISSRLAELQPPDQVAVVLLCEPGQDGLSAEADRLLFGYLEPHAPTHQWAKMLGSALGTVRLRHEQAVRSRQLKELNQIGVALSAERNLDTLLDLILTRAREMTSADAGSIYLLIDRPGEEHDELIFERVQNDTVQLPFEKTTIPKAVTSLAWHTVETGETLRLPDVYELTDDVPYQFNPGFDKVAHYRTRSMLVVPMRHQEYTRGVLQLINRKRSRDVALADMATVDDQVIEFDEEDQDLVESLASQAAVALENQLLLEGIQSIFEGFVNGWVKAVEDRDEATAGHSLRVTALTMALARIAGLTTDPPFAELTFPEAKMRELRYAGLLHDIGKIYVRPEVFVKAKRLYPNDKQSITLRFGLARRTHESVCHSRKLELVLAAPAADHAEELDLIDAEHEARAHALARYLETIEAIDDGTLVDVDRRAELEAIAQDSFRELAVDEAPLLTAEELARLRIERGTLTEEERKEIESHVEHSERILSRIPWTPDLLDIPAIAAAHHEKLDGSGYPHGLTADRIPIQAKMMTIADIYDALTAADRPYKKAMPTSRALEILGFERDEGHIDGELLALFEEHEVWELAHRPMDGIRAAIDRMVRGQAP